MSLEMKFYSESNFWKITLQIKAIDVYMGATCLSAGRPENIWICLYEASDKEKKKEDKKEQGA